MALDANEVTAASKAIEGLLKQRGARGRGLHELLDSLEPSLPPAVVKKARLVASVRNKVVHDAGYAPAEKDAQAFRAAVQAVSAQLEALPAAGDGPGEAAEAAAPRPGRRAATRAPEAAPDAPATDTAAQDGAPARTRKPSRPRARSRPARGRPALSREHQAVGIVLAGVALAAMALWFFHA